MYFAGWTLACVIVPRLGDIYGRKWPFLVSLGASILIYIGFILSRDVRFSIALFFFFGVCCVGKANIAYIYLLELTPVKWQTYVGTMLLFADGFTMIAISLYFRYISKDWLWYDVYALAMTAFAFFGSLIVPESPKYLYSYKKYKEAK